ncbi:MAG: polysaccharide deacetylase family protein [Anaerovoracaceae bacterium]
MENETSNYYFGSVKFFRHLIIGSIVLILVLLIVAVGVLSVKCIDYAKIVQNQAVLVETGSDKGVSLLSSNSFVWQRDKKVFLTFDDGPNKLTETVLDVLAANHIKATFFVVGNQITSETEPILKRMVKEGHTIGVHTTTHNYEKIYKSVDSYLDDFYETYDKIYEATGVCAEIFRFPGGSQNAYNEATCKEIIKKMEQRGFKYFDWNASAEDADNNANRKSVIKNALKGTELKSDTILLMHDNKACTVESLDEIINEYKEKGYNFDSLDKRVKQVSFVNR